MDDKDLGEHIDRNREQIVQDGPVDIEGFGGVKDNIHVILSDLIRQKALEYAQSERLGQFTPEELAQAIIETSINYFTNLENLSEFISKARETAHPAHPKEDKTPEP